MANPNNNINFVIDFNEEEVAPKQIKTLIHKKN